MKSLFTVVVVLTLAVLGCKMPAFLEGSNSNTPASNSTTTSAGGTQENPAAAPTDDARSDVIRASKKFLDLPRFSATMDGMGGGPNGGTPMNVALDFQAPDRFHMKYLEPSGQVRNEMMVIGRDMYMKHGPSWQKMPGAVGESIPNMRQFFDEKGLASLKDVKYVGDDTLDGRKAYVYSYRNDVQNGQSPYPFTSKIWVRSNDGLPQKIEVDYEAGELKTVTILYDYDKAVNIEPPKTK